MFLALEGRRGSVPRDKLLALFWPESDEAHARNALSQSLHHLRHALGPGVIESWGSSAVEIGTERLWCDATAFADALERGEAELALDLYRGEFCPALFAGDAPELERWIEDQRGRLRASAFDATRVLAERLASRGDYGSAARLARRALALGPHDEPAVRSLIGLLDRLGDRAGALRAYEEFAERLRQELETEPAPETRDLAEQIRTRSSLTPFVAETAPPGSAAEPARTPAQDGQRRRRRRGVLVLLAVLLVGTAALARSLALRAATRNLDPRLLVIAPFRVATADSSLLFLREGMLDLLETRLSGPGGKRVADPRAVVAAWRLALRGGADPTAEQAAAIARRLGGSQLLLGSAVGTVERLSLTAEVRSALSGNLIARSDVIGPADSLPRLLDALAGQLLVAESPESAGRVANPGTTSLRALRAYLAGRSAFRQGRYAEAVRLLHQAVEADTGFAIAYADLAEALDWADDGTRVEVSHRAHALSTRLPPRERAYLGAVLGPRFPDLTPAAERIRAWERAVQLSPDRASAHYGLADDLFHWGALLAIPEWESRARAGFSRALALDSGFSAPAAHLLQLALRQGDNSSVRRYAQVYFAGDSGDVAMFLAWRVATSLGDSTTIRHIEGELDRIPLQSLLRIGQFALIDGVRTDVAGRVMEVLDQRATTDGERKDAHRLHADAGAALGRLSETAEAWSRLGLRRAAVAAALFTLQSFDDGDPRASERALAGAGRPPDAAAAAVAALYSGALLDSAGVRSLERWLDDQPGTDRWSAALRALWAARRSRPDAGRLVSIADSLFTARSGSASLDPVSLLVIARCQEVLGDIRGALRTVRRRPYDQWLSLNYLAGSLREEGRLAALAGDTAGAIRAYRHYVALRYDPDPEIVPIVQQVREELARLGSARGVRR